MSPLFHRRSEEEKAAERAAAEERRAAGARAAERTAASLALIEAGRIPLAASERLGAFAAGTAGGGGGEAFSSDLAVSEWSALARLGVRPVTQVMGSSVFHVGWQPTYYNVPTEVSVLSDAYNECRRLALGRLREEASACRADAVVGVRIEQGAHDWAAGAIEFIALGTAVTLPPELATQARETVLSDLTGQEFALLCQAGMRPVGIAAHTSVHYVPASAQTQRAQSSMMASWANQELVDFSQGVYEAREKALASISSQVRDLGGDGIIGVQLGQSGRTHAVQRGLYESKDLEVTFHVMGTVIREDPSLAPTTPPAPPMQILALS
jgi:uncharacterized protein YbjQ (UPF0145 family)